MLDPAHRLAALHIDFGVAAFNGQRLIDLDGRTFWHLYLAREKKWSNLKMRERSLAECRVRNRKSKKNFADLFPAEKKAHMSR